jgi:hypothetical protein
MVRHASATRCQIEMHLERIGVGACDGGQRQLQIRAFKACTRVRDCPC